MHCWLSFEPCTSVASQFLNGLQAEKYAWVETWSEAHNRPFYYDQANQVSTWEKPADLAWRRVYILPENEAETQSATASKLELK